MAIAAAGTRTGVVRAEERRRGRDRRLLTGTRDAGGEPAAAAAALVSLLRGAQQEERGHRHGMREGDTQAEPEKGEDGKPR